MASFQERFKGKTSIMPKEGLIGAPTNEYTPITKEPQISKSSPIKLENQDYHHKVNRNGDVTKKSKNNVLNNGDNLIYSSLNLGNHHDNNGLGRLKGKLSSENIETVDRTDSSLIDDKYRRNRTKDDRTLVNNVESLNISKPNRKIIKIENQNQNNYVPSFLNNSSTESQPRKIKITKRQINGTPLSLKDVPGNIKKNAYPINKSLSIQSATYDNLHTFQSEPLMKKEMMPEFFSENTTPIQRKNLFKISNSVVVQSPTAEQVLKKDNIFSSVNGTSNPSLIKNVPNLQNHHNMLPPYNMRKPKSDNTNKPNANRLLKNDIIYEDPISNEQDEEFHKLEKQHLDYLNRVEKFSFKK